MQRHLRRALRGRIAQAMGILAATLLVALVVFLLVRPKARAVPAADTSPRDRTHQAGPR